MYTKIRPLFLISLALYFLLLSGCTTHQHLAERPHAVSQEPCVKEDQLESSWWFLGGYGETHPGLRSTETRIQTYEAILRYERFLEGDKGSSWYASKHSLMVEAPFSRIETPYSGYITGINFLANWTFTSPDSFKPYIFIGGGPVYVGADIPDMGTRWNGNYQFGIGVRRKISDRHSLLFEWRYHHISNGGRVEPNASLDGTKFLIGINF